MHAAAAARVDARALAYAGAGAGAAPTAEARERSARALDATRAAVAQAVGREHLRDRAQGQETWVLKRPTITERAVAEATGLPLPVRRRRARAFLSP